LLAERPDERRPVEPSGTGDDEGAPVDRPAPTGAFLIPRPEAVVDYFITHNCEIDCRAGIGLNQHADGYLFGSGFAIRY
jgi:hypothetical protein